jgi:hypothetical protein
LEPFLESVLRPGRDPDAQEHNIPSQASNLCPEKMTQDLRGILMPRSITSLHRLRITVWKKMTRDLGGIPMPRSITSLHRLRISVHKMTLDMGGILMPRSITSLHRLWISV